MVINYAVSTVINKILGPKKPNAPSPTYSIGPLQTQTNSSMIMPIIYGKVKCAGNNLWQSGQGSTVQRLVGFGLGRNAGVSDVKLDDKPIADCGCSYTAYMGDGEQIIDSRVTGATQADKAKLVGGLKYDAYLALTIVASDKISSSPNVTAVWQGRVVRIYSSPTAYTEAWSDNPAWCILDFYMSIDGCDVPEAHIDIQSFIAAAAYFDQKKWSLNLILDEKKKRQDWLVEMLACCRSWPTYNRGKYGILVDKPEPVSQIFTIQPDETLELSYSELSDMVERIIIKYPDPSYEWQMIGAPATMKPPFRRRKPLDKTVEMRGITNFPQASQMAWFYLNRAQTCTEHITYTCNARALNRTIGDVVGVFDPVSKKTEPNLPYKRYRIMQITEPQENQIQLYMQEYNESLYGDQQGSVAPVVNVITVGDMTNPPPVSGLALDEYGWMQKDGSHISSIDVSWTAPDYGFTEGFVISLSEDGVQYRTAGTAMESPFRISNLQIGKRYWVAVQTRSKGMGRCMSAKTVGEITLVGKDNPPGDVTGFSVTQAGAQLIAAIKLLQEPDIACYELRLGLTWENSVQIGQFTSEKFTFDAVEEGTLIYWIRARDNFGNQSVNPTRAMCNVFGLPPKNIIYTVQEELTKWSGYHAYFWDGKWKISARQLMGDYATAGEVLAAKCELWDDAELYLPNIDLGDGVIEQDSFYTDPWGNKKIMSQKTLGDCATAGEAFSAYYPLRQIRTITSTFFSADVKYAQAASNRVDVYYAAHLTEPLVNAIYVPRQVRQFFGRYLEVRLMPKSLDGLTNVDVSAATISIDVVDVEETISNVAIPAAKTHIAFKQNFYAAPDSVACFVSDAAGRSARYYKSNITRDGFDIEILDDAGNLVAGKVDYAIIRGF